MSHRINLPTKKVYHIDNIGNTYSLSQIDEMVNTRDYPKDWDNRQIAFFEKVFVTPYTQDSKRYCKAKTLL